MIRTIKISMMIILGLSVANPLIAMHQAPESKSEIMDKILDAIKGMNKVCLEKTKELFGQYNSTNDDAWKTDPVIIQAIIKEAAIASHSCQACTNYLDLKLKLDPALRDKVNTAVQDQRAKHLPVNSDKTIGDFTNIMQAIEAITAFCTHNVTEVEKIMID